MVSMSVCVCVCDKGEEKESSVYGLRAVIISLSAAAGVGAKGLVSQFLSQHVTLNGHTHIHTFP